MEDRNIALDRLLGMIHPGMASRIWKRKLGFIKLMRYIYMYMYTIIYKLFMYLYITCKRREWQPAPVFLLGESRGQRSLVGYSPCGLKELDLTEAI